MNSFKNKLKALTYATQKNAWLSYKRALRRSLTKRDWIILIINLAILFVVFTCISYVYLKTTHLCSNIKIFYFMISKCTDILLTLFAVIFAGYAIFLSLLSHDSVVMLIKNGPSCGKNNNVSYYELYGDFFFAYLYSLFILLCVSIILLIFMHAFKSIHISLKCCKLLWIISSVPGLYLSLFAVLIYNLKDLIYNIFSAFVLLGIFHGLNH